MHFKGGVFFLKYWFPVLAYASLIFLLSSMPKPPDVLPFVFPHSDKLKHFLEYALFGYLVLRALYYSKKDTRILALRTAAIIISFVYACSDELHQYFIPGRHMELLDILSDTFGACVGQLLFRIK
jgi:VanZ family protein